MPGWALAGTGALTPQPLRPPRVGLVQWVKGDADLVVAATRVSAWGDQSPMGQDWGQSNATNYPYDLGDQIDGIPCVSFGVAGDANKFFQTAGNFVDRLGNPMDGAAARTIMVVWKPRFDAAYGRTGGTIWGQGDGNKWNAAFELRSDFVANGAYGFIPAGGDYTNAQQFTPVTGGAGGPYNGTPTLCQWSSSGAPALSFRVNNAPTVLTPATMFGPPGAAARANLSIEFIANLGAISEQLAWDYDLETDAAAQTQAIDYVRSRYPSLVLA